MVMLSVYQNCPEMVVLLLEFYVDVVDSQISFLGAVSCVYSFVLHRLCCWQFRVQNENSNVKSFQELVTGDMSLLMLFVAFDFLVRMRWLNCTRLVWHSFKLTENAT